MGASDTPVYAMAEIKYVIRVALVKWAVSGFSW
jgi:hypothetical protein